MNRDESRYQLSHAYYRFRGTTGSPRVKNRKNYYLLIASTVQCNAKQLLKNIEYIQLMLHFYLTGRRWQRFFRRFNRCLAYN